MSDFFAPLRSRAFRWLEGTAVFSNVSIWILTLVTGFIMETLTRVPILIAMASAMTSLTAIASVTFSGAAADTRDRRVVILVAKVVLVSSALFLTVISLGHLLTPTTLLIGLAGIGLASGTSSPSWWTTASSLVPPQLAPAALAIDSFQWNIGQVIGPVLGGYILHELGSSVLFFVCSVLALPLIIFLVVWKGPGDLRLSTPGSAAAEKLLGSVSAGWRFFYNTPSLRAIAARTALYVVPAAAVSALLPLYATRYLHATSFTYGLYLAIGGVGAMAAAVVLPRLQGRLHLDVLVAVATVLNGLAVLGLALFPLTVTAIPALLLTGGTWVWATTVFTIATREATPEWVRTRSLAIYYIVLQGPYALGGIGFGVLDSLLPLRVTLIVDAALFLPAILLIPRYGLPVIDRSAVQMVAPQNVAVGHPIDPEDGPVLILVEYRIAEPDIDDYLAAMAELRIVRRRLGATRWGVFEDVIEHGKFVETFLVGSWEDYVRQRAHYTRADAEVEARAWAFHRGPGEPVVTRLVHPDTVEAARARSSWRREMARLVTEPFIDEAERAAAEARESAASLGEQESTPGALAGGTSDEPRPR